MKRTIALLLALVMALSLAACIQVPSWQTVQSTGTPVVTAEPTATPSVTCGVTLSPSPETTPEPTAEPTAEPAPAFAEDTWAAIDMDFFREYLISDITSLHQLVKDPAKYGIDYDSVERTLGTYQLDGEREWYAFVEKTLGRMDKLDRGALSEQDQLAYDTMRQFLELELEGEQYYGYFEPLAPYTGIQADLPLVFWFYELNNRQDVEDYLTLLADVPRFFQDLLEYERYRAEKLNIFMIEANLDKIIEDLDNVIQAKDTIFLIPLFSESLAKVDGLTGEEIKAYEDRNLALLTNEFNQAFVDLKAGLEALRPYCREDVGIKATGNETYLKWYEYQLRISCNEIATPNFMANLLQNYGRDFLNKALKAYQTARDQDHISMGSVEENVEYLHSVLDPLLPPLPQVEVRYEEVAEELKDVASPAFYLIPSFDDWQHNMIGLNDPQSASNLLSTLAHEGFNGHLYQYVYHRSLPGLSLSQQLLESTAYAEAWSQFSEHLLADHIDKKYTVADMQADHYGSQCIVEMVGYWAIRVNWFGDDFDQVYTQLGRLTGMGEEEFRTDIYEPFIIGHPFYYMPYAYGYARLISFVEEAQKTLGAKFDEKAFYAQYLNYGPSYFDLLAERLLAWEQAQ